VEYKSDEGKGLREGWDSKELWKSVEKEKPKEVDSPDGVGIFDRQLASKKRGQRLNAESTESGAQRSQRKKQIPHCARDDDFALSAGPGARRLRAPNAQYGLSSVEFSTG